jgi:hypothetical protein
MNKINIYKLIFVVFIALILFSASCRSKRIFHFRNHLHKDIPLSKLLDSINLERLQYTYFSSRISVEVDAPGFDKSFKTNLRVKKDSIIWMSISALNIVVANAAITKDSFKLVNKFDKKYLLESFNYLNEIFDTEIDYLLFQQIIAGNLPQFNMDDKLKLLPDTACYLLSTVGKRKLKRSLEKDKQLKKENIIYRYWIYPGIFRPARIVINDLQDTTELDIKYLQYEMVNSSLVPMDVLINASSPRQKASIFLKYSRTKVNEITDFPFNVPEGYEKME